MRESGRGTWRTGSGRWRHRALLTPAVAVLSLLLAGPAGAAPAQAPAHPVTTSYDNQIGRAHV